MKKLIIIEDNSELKIGDIFKQDGKLYRYLGIERMCTSNKKVQFYIINTEAEIDEGDYIYHDITKKIQKSKYSTLELKMLERHLVIATSNNSLPLPQLSKQAIEYIVEKNGELGEFDLEVDSKVLFSDIVQIPIKGLKHPGYNIIPKSSKRTKEDHELNLQLVNHGEEPICLKCNSEMKPLYSEEEVLNLFIDYNNSLNEFGEGLPFDKWFKQNKKK